jgi:cytochrome c6
MKSSIFKKGIKRLQWLASFVIIVAFGYHIPVQAQNPPLTGRALFEKKCATCHGNDGTRGRWGAKNLQISKLDNDELLNTISNGRGIMPNWGKKLSASQISSIIEYIKTLRK